MRALFGVVALLVALAIVGLTAVKQLKAVGQIGPSPAASPETPVVPTLSGSGNVRQQVQRVQDKAAGDLARALNEAAAARAEEPEKR